MRSKIGQWLNWSSLTALDYGENDTGISAENKKSEPLPFPNLCVWQSRAPLSLDPVSFPSLAEKGRSRVAGWKGRSLCAGMVYIHLKGECRAKEPKIIEKPPTSSHWALAAGDGNDHRKWWYPMVLGFPVQGGKRDEKKRSIHLYIHVHIQVQVCVFPSFLLTSLWLWAYAFHRPHSGLRTCCPGSPQGPSLMVMPFLSLLQPDFDLRVAIPAFWLPSVSVLLWFAADGECSIHFWAVAFPTSPRRGLQNHSRHWEG